MFQYMRGPNDDDDDDDDNDDSDLMMMMMKVVIVLPILPHQVAVRAAGGGQWN